MVVSQTPLGATSDLCEDLNGPPGVSGEGRQGVMGEKTHSEFYDQYTKVLGPLLLELHTSCRSESSFISLVHLDKTFC